VAVTLTWWSYHGTGSNVQSMSSLPAKVRDGGNQLEILTDASTPSTVRVSFEDLRKPVGQQILIEAWEKIPAGTRSWTIDVPGGIGGYIELNADHPNPGDTLSATVKMNGREVARQAEKLERPLEPNTAFFVQFEYNDLSKAGSEPDSPPEE
jgi:hypothetical protein